MTSVKDLTGWTKWFAWYPVYTNDLKCEKIWLRWCERRLITEYFDIDDPTWTFMMGNTLMYFEYRKIKKTDDWFKDWRFP